MPVHNIAGRGPEIKILHRAIHSDRSELIAVYGRRRVGKTYLVREFFDDRICFELTAIHRATFREQLVNFAGALSEAYNSRLPLRSPETWQEAFAQLKAFLSTYGSKGKKVAFLDELPWLITPRSGFLKHLEHFWKEIKRCIIQDF